MSSRAPPDFDFAIENPTTLAILRSLMGELITFEEFEILIRNPTTKTQDIKAWHRDATRDYNRRMEIEYVSLVYYLTDVSENDHCLSIIPGSHYRLVDLKPADVTPGSEFDVTGPAGTAVIFHGRCIHAGKLKPTLKAKAHAARLLRPQRSAEIFRVDRHSSPALSKSRSSATASALLEVERQPGV